MAKHLGNHCPCVSLRELRRRAHSRQHFRSERRDVAGISLGEYEPPFVRSFGAELHGQHPVRGQKLAERISPHSFVGGCYAGADILAAKITGAVEEVGELVTRSRTPPRRRPAPLGECLLDGLESDVVASFATNHLVEHRAVERQQRGTLLGARSVIAVEPVHHEAELQARRERGWYLGLHGMNPDISGGDLSESVLETLHVERFLKHLPIRLDEDRKARELPHGLKKIE